MRTLLGEMKTVGSGAGDARRIWVGGESGVRMRLSYLFGFQIDLILFDPFIQLEGDPSHKAVCTVAAWADDTDEVLWPPGWHCWRTKRAHIARKMAARWNRLPDCVGHPEQ
jgi:hypothetical protein